MVLLDQEATVVGDDGMAGAVAGGGHYVPARGESRERPVGGFLPSGFGVGSDAQAVTFDSAFQHELDHRGGRHGVEFRFGVEESPQSASDPVHGSVGLLDVSECGGVGRAGDAADRGQGFGDLLDCGCLVGGGGGHRSAAIPGPVVRMNTDDSSRLAFMSPSRPGWVTVPSGCSWWTTV